MSLLLGLLIGVPGISALLWRVATLGSHSMRELFAYVFGVLFFFNVVDLIILDWLIVCWLKPRWTIVPGTEHVVVPNPYMHHFNEFLMGTAGLFSLRGRDPVIATEMTQGVDIAGSNSFGTTVRYTDIGSSARV